MIACVLAVAVLAGPEAAAPLQAATSTQTAPAPAQKPPTPVPQGSAPARPRAASAAPAPTPTTSLAVTVTDLEGAVLGDVMVSLIGTTDREARTSDTGFARLQTLPAGTWRLRFSREGFHTFEKELVWRAGQPAPSLLVTLSPAPPPPAPPPPPPPPAPVAPVLPPPGRATSMALPDFIEKNFIGGRDAQREDQVGCSGLGRGVLWQVRDPWPARSHDDADVMLYVMGGEGSVRLDARDVTLAAGSFAVVPRGTSYAFTRRGRNPLIVLAFFAGTACPAP